MMTNRIASLLGLQYEWWQSKSSGSQLFPLLTLGSWDTGIAQCGKGTAKIAKSNLIFSSKYSEYKKAEWCHVEQNFTLHKAEL